MYDGATPSGNSLMATNLIILSVYFDMSSWRKRAEQMILNSRKLAEKYPDFFWCVVLKSAIIGLWLKRNCDNRGRLWPRAFTGIK
jgi:uncharacterized protein YyaL (SSP411 family)